MRRFLLPALMISLLLTGCGGENAAMRKAEQQREILSETECIGFTAEITAYPGGEIFSCTIRCEAGKEETDLEILAPESIAGIRAVLRDGETTLHYEDLSLGLAAMGFDSVTPLSALPLLAQALRSGFLLRCWRERDGDRELIAAEIYVTDDAELTVWFLAEEMMPVACEFMQDGELLLACEIREFFTK